MEPFYFDSAGCELFGVYHPALDGSANRAVVLCPPFGNESSRIYQAVGALAQQWSETTHVLRFDYTATGDSFGDWEQAGPNCWINDIVRAVDEVVEISGAERITLAGVRFGALLAANAATHPAVSELIAWDPVISGQHYRHELDGLHRRLVDLHDNLTSSEKAQAEAEFCGFSKPSWLDTEVPKLMFPASLANMVQAVSIVQSNGQQDASKATEPWLGEFPNLDRRAVDFDCEWDSEFVAIMHPSPIITELGTCL